MAGLSCGGSCMKYILFLFNIVFFITGAAILGVGIWLKVDPDASNILKVVEINEGSSLMTDTLWVLIGIGAFIFLVGFLGCCGACKESSSMLCLYAGLLVIVFILEITVAILAIVYKSKISEGLKTSMQKQVKNDVTENPKDATTIMWNTLQFGFKCCGAVNAKDYENSEFANSSALPIPLTCCRMDKFNVDKPTPEDYDNCKSEYATGRTDGKDLYYKGCYDGLKDWINSHTAILIGIGFGIAAIQLFGILFACAVRKQINQYEQYS